jgi:hypothetical protein
MQGYGQQVYNLCQQLQLLLGPAVIPQAGEHSLLHSKYDC